jgi:transposase
MMPVLEREERAMSIVTIGIDLGKDSCSLAGLDERGGVVLRRRMRPATVVSFASKLAPCTIAMEACCGAHYLGRLLAAQGHTVKLMAPEYVRPYVKAQKNDDRDAEAIAEAATRPTMRFVELKSQEQLDIQSLHRVRSRLVTARTTLTNQLRALLLERGMTFAKGRRKFEVALDALLADAERLAQGRIRQLLVDMREEWSALDQRIDALDEEFIALARTDEVARRLISIPGIGALNATALIAAVGQAESFGHARDLGAFLGLVPRQHTTGGKPRLLGISKRGNAYIRTQLIHGARAALPSLAKSETALGEWLRGLLARRHYNTVVVALANKLARIAWALMRRQTTFSVGRAASV